MNEITAAQRMRVAATEKGGAERILRVNYAEGDAQSKALAGRESPISARRSSRGCATRSTEFRKSVPGTTGQEVMNLVLMTQYFDMLKEFGASSRSNATLVPHSPSSVAALTDQLRTAMFEANQIADAANSAPHTNGRTTRPRS